MVFFSDALTLDAPRRTSDGYLAVRAKASRTGVYQYSGGEVDPDNAHGLRDQAVVNVLRDDAAVFDERSVRSFIGKPITNDHPSEAVTAANWKRYADGVNMGAIRDGDHLAFDLLLMDATAIADVDAGKRELSNGYAAELQFGDFTGPGGEKCQARQTNITGNHIALVDRGRAGPTCRIADAAPCAPAPQSFLDSITTKEKPVKTMLIDGLTVDVSNADTAIATITTILAARDAANTKVTTLETQAVTDAATIVAKDAEIVKLTADLAAAKPTLQQLRDAGKAFAVIEGKAKAAGVTVTDAMDEAAIMKAVVDKAMGDKSKDYTADKITIAFDVLTKDTKVEDANVQSLGNPTNVADADKAANDARAEMIADMAKTTTAAAA